jgi:hypothetical protein
MSSPEASSAPAARPPAGAGAAVQPDHAAAPPTAQAGAAASASALQANRCGRFIEESAGKTRKVAKAYESLPPAFSGNHIRSCLNDCNDLCDDRRFIPYSLPASTPVPTLCGQRSVSQPQRLLPAAAKRTDPRSYRLAVHTSESARAARPHQQRVDRDSEVADRIAAHIKPCP